MPQIDLSDDARGDIKRHFNVANYDCLETPLLLNRDTYKDTLKTVKECSFNQPFITVFSSSRDLECFPQFKKHAQEVGVLLANTNAIYVYGNGNSGMMGVAAKSFMRERVASKGFKHHIVGVTVDKFASTEENYKGVIVFNARDLDLRERFLIDLADAFIVLHGGAGTDAEFTKFISQDGYIKKTGRPVAVVNTEIDYEGDRIGCYDNWKQQIELNLFTGAANPKHYENIYFAPNPECAVSTLVTKLDNLAITGPHGSFDFDACAEQVKQFRMPQKEDPDTYDPVI